MKIIAMADLHGRLPPDEDVPACDLLIIAGDICPDFNRSEMTMRQAAWLNRDFWPWLRDVKATHVVMTWGNHDRIGQRRDWPLGDVPVNVNILVDDWCDIGGLKIYATPWTREFGWSMAFMTTEESLVDVYEKIPAGLDILISHGPPKGYCDYLVGEHLGSASLAATVDIAQPRMQICGHIHHGRGWMPTPWGGKVANVASVNEKYEPHDPMWTEIEMETEDGKSSEKNAI